MNVRDGNAGYTRPPRPRSACATSRTRSASPRACPTPTTWPPSSAPAASRAPPAAATGVEGAAHQPVPPRALHARGRARAHVHPAGHGRGLRGDVQPAGVRAGGHQVQDQLARRVHGCPRATAEVGPRGGRGRRARGMRRATPLGAEESGEPERRRAGSRGTSAAAATRATSRSHTDAMGDL